MTGVDDNGNGSGAEQDDDGEICADADTLDGDVMADAMECFRTQTTFSNTKLDTALIWVEKLKMS